MNNQARQKAATVRVAFCNGAQRWSYIKPVILALSIRYV